MNSPHAASLPVLLRTLQDSVRRATLKDLAIALTAARERTEILDRAFELAWTMPYDGYLRRQLAVDLQGIRVIGMIIDRHLDQEHDADHSSTVTLIHDLDDLCDLAHTLSVNLNHPRVAVLMRRLTPHRTALEHARLLATELAVARRVAVRFLPSDLWRLTPSGEIGSARTTMRSALLESGTVVGGMAEGRGFALLMLALAVQTLPSPHRSRYREEFRAELGDHVSWASRTSYVVRLSAQMWSLRRSLPSKSELRRQRLSQTEPIVGEEA